MSITGIDIMRAVAALRLKPTARYHTDGDDVVIQQPGKPDLILTADAARRFNNQIDEANA
jgi:hypothetical protein